MSPFSFLLSNLVAEFVGTEFIRIGGLSVLACRMLGGLVEFSGLLRRRVELGRAGRIPDSDSEKFPGCSVGRPE